VRRWLSADDRPVLVGGSTHGHEEVWVAEAAREAAARLGIDLRVVLAPRHPERSSQVAEALEQHGWVVRRWSRHQRKSPPWLALRGKELVLVDTIGDLEAFYGACDLAYVGGSLVPHGGQNMLEPASMGRAVVFGPHIANFQRDVEILLGASAARQVSDRSELAVAFAELLGDAAERRRLGEAAVDVILRNKGATARTLTRLQPILEVPELPRAG
jgi:3-deoxy-D-manno-octulosonic-acid transferase